MGNSKSKFFTAKTEKQLLFLPAIKRTRGLECVWDSHDKHYTTETTHQGVALLVIIVGRW